MQTRNRFLDDLARVAGGAVGALSGVREEVEARVRQQFERILQDMDLVTREEFDAVQMVAQAARMEQERLADRVAELEALVAELRGGDAAPSGARPAKAASTRKRAAGGKGGDAPDAGDPASSPKVGE
jgi:BMFP domain-containing protein YqiC